MVWSNCMLIVSEMYTVVLYTIYTFISPCYVTLTSLTHGYAARSIYTHALLRQYVTKLYIYVLIIRLIGL